VVKNQIPATQYTYLGGGIYYLNSGTYAGDPFPAGYYLDPSAVADNEIEPEVLNDRCLAYKRMLNLQRAKGKEVSAFVTKEGKVIIMPMKNNTLKECKVTFPIKDIYGRNAAGLVIENGKHYIELYDWTTTPRSATSYEIQAYVHTHPVGVPNTSPDIASGDDQATAATFPGLQFFIINDNKIIEYNTTNKALNTNTNNCK
jgi:hypothetical protein